MNEYNTPHPARKSDSPWMTRLEAAEFLRVHPDTIDNHRVLWTEGAVIPGKMRYKMLKIGSSRLPRIWREDVERILQGGDPATN
jgi:hypothetical protein